MLQQLADLQRIGIKNSEGIYSIRKTGIAEYSLYRVDGTEEFVGYVTGQSYYCKITRHVAGLTLSKEIAYTEIAQIK